MEIKKINDLINENSVCLFMKGTARKSTMWIFYDGFEYFKTLRCKVYRY